MILYSLLFPEITKSMEGVIFEIGCICCRYGCGDIGDRLMLLSSKQYDWDKRTPYMSTLIPRTIRDEFDEESKYHRASRRIDIFAVGYILQRRGLTP
jgi:hypothetical protein